MCAEQQEITMVVILAVRYQEIDGFEDLEWIVPVQEYWVKTMQNNSSNSSECSLMKNTSREQRNDIYP